MKKFLFAVIFLVIGGAVGGFLAMGVGTGFGAAAGIAVGSQAGVCFAMETAKSNGLLTAEQIDKVIEKDCADMVAKMEAEVARSSP